MQVQASVETGTAIKQDCMEWLLRIFEGWERKGGKGDLLQILTWKEKFCFVESS